MGKITETELKNRLKSGKLSRVYFLCGEERFLIKTYMERILDIAVPKDARDMNYVKYSIMVKEDTPKTSEIADFLDSIPFLSEYKCVVIEDLNADAMDVTEHKAYLSLIENVPEGSILIIAQNNLEIDLIKPKAKMKKLMDTCAKSGEFVEMKYLSPAVINGMTVRKLAKSGCTISSQNAGYLAEECGGDLTVLQNEIAKLSAYKPGKEITREDIDKLVPKRIETNIYDLAKQLMSGRIDSALDILNTLFIQRVEPVIILAALSGHFTDLYRAKLALNAGKSVSDASAAFKYPPNRSFVMKNAFNSVRNLRIEYLGSCIAVLYDTNRLLNSSKADKRTFLERAIVEIANTAGK